MLNVNVKVLKCGVQTQLHMFLMLNHGLETLALNGRCVFVLFLNNRFSMAFQSAVELVKTIELKPWFQLKPLKPWFQFYSRASISDLSL